MIKKLKAIILLMILGVASLVSGCSTTSENTQANREAEESYIPVAVEKATVDVIENQRKLNGKLFANNEMYVIPSIVGMVNKVDVELGDSVKKGDTLFSVNIAQGPGGMGMVQKVTSPIAGVVSALNAKEGQIATNSQPAATIVEMNQVYIQVNVVESIVNRVQVGQEVEVNVPAAFDEYITSTISYISPTADPRSQLYPVKVYISNLDTKIRPGMNGQIRVGLDTVNSAIIVKANAVLDKDGQKVVYVVEDNIAVEKIVTTGLDTGEYVEIKEGINEGDRVIVEGQHYVENGKIVKVVRGE